MTIHHDPWIGETAVTGNLPPREFRAPVIFSTDKLGFRLTPEALSQPKIDFLLTGGASFAYGGGLSDDETFPAVLTRDEKLPTYNAGRFYWDSTHFIYVAKLVDRLKAQKPSAAIYLYWENMNPPLDVRQLDPLPWRIDGLGKAAFGESRYAELRERVQYDNRYLTAILSVSPMEVLSTRFFKRLSNGRILPNRYAAAVVSPVLPNGQRILFLQTEIQRVLSPPSDDLMRQHADFFEEYARRLAALNMGLYVILMPNKYSLYGSSSMAGRRAHGSLSQSIGRAFPATLDGLERTFGIEAPCRADIESGNFAIIATTIIGRPKEYGESLPHLRSSFASGANCVRKAPMFFNSLVFLFAFLPITYFVFWLLKEKRSRYIWLAITGYVFYGYWNPKFCLLMLFSTVVSYTAGLGFLRWVKISGHAVGY
jgi:hypothetical protein